MAKRNQEIRIMLTKKTTVKIQRPEKTPAQFRCIQPTNLNKQNTQKAFYKVTTHTSVIAGAVNFAGFFMVGLPVKFPCSTKKVVILFQHA